MAVDVIWIYKVAQGGKTFYIRNEHLSTAPTTSEGGKQAYVDNLIWNGLYKSGATVSIVKNKMF